MIGFKKIEIMIEMNYGENSLRNYPWVEKQINCSQAMSEVCRIGSIPTHALMHQIYTWIGTIKSRAIMYQNSARTGMIPELYGKMNDTATYHNVPELHVNRNGTITCHNVHQLSLNWNDNTTCHNVPEFNATGKIPPHAIMYQNSARTWTTMYQNRTGKRTILPHDKMYQNCLARNDTATFHDVRTLPGSQRAHDVMVTSLLRQNDVSTSTYNGVIITSYVHSERNDSDICQDVQ